ncbi:MAG: dihydropteroate synthase [Gammaproteobacteria bacterium]|nr:dihydropteroate synthase [Gammaproteobacteria bacterium]
MADHILLLTGKLAEKSLRRVMESIAAREFTYEIANIGVSVAALMTTDMIARRLTDTRGAARILVPGLCTGDFEAAGERLGVPLERGPVDLKDLPAYFGRGARQRDLSQYDMQIFAEITDAPRIGVQEILARAAEHRRDGADVIDLGCLPSTPFPHLEEAVQALIAAGHTVSVDSVEPEELRRGGRAGAHYLLSLKESTLAIAEELAATPILIPESAGDIESLHCAMDRLAAQGRRFIADSILDPIHFGFTESIVRYHALRQRYPHAEIMMGVGNLTELTEADTTGLNMLLLGVMSELRITHLLTTQVSPHAAACVREIDRARRIMHAAREDSSLPKGYDSGLIIGHERKPFPYTTEEIREMAALVRDPSYRVQVSADGIHVYNREERVLGGDPFRLFSELGLLQNDAPHAFYMGVELARAQIAWQLGKRYVQDGELNWGVAVPPERQGEKADMHAYKGEGSTLQARRRRESDK